MRLSREVTILSRIVDVVCWNEEEQKVGGHGYRVNRYAIDLLSKRGVLKNLDSTWARTVRSDWARDDWRSDDGSTNPVLDQEAVDNIIFMADQFIGEPDASLAIDAFTSRPQVWIEAIEFLQELKIAEIDEDTIQLVSEQEAHLLTVQKKLAAGDKKREFRRLRAKLNNQAHMHRR